MRSKSAHLRSIGKLGVVPALFNINEPVIFGSPIVMNPILFFPFVVAPMVNATIAWFLPRRQGLIGKVISLVPWTALRQWRSMGSRLDDDNGLLVITDCHRPADLPAFFKVYEKQLLAQEAEKTEADMHAQKCGVIQN